MVSYSLADEAALWISQIWPIWKFFSKKFEALIGAPDWCVNSIIAVFDMYFLLLNEIFLSSSSSVQSPWIVFYDKSFIDFIQTFKLGLNLCVFLIEGVWRKNLQSFVTRVLSESGNLTIPIALSSKDRISCSQVSGEIHLANTLNQIGCIRSPYKMCEVSEHCVTYADTQDRKVNRSDQAQNL